MPPVPQSPSPSISEWQDASSEILSDKDTVDTVDEVDGDLATKYPLVNYGLTKRRLSRGHSGSQRSRKVQPNLEDIEFPSLDYGPHLRFFPEEDGMFDRSLSTTTVGSQIIFAGETPDENDLFPSTPLDEDQLPHAHSKLKEELGSVVINEIQVRMRN